MMIKINLIMSMNFFEFILTVLLDFLKEVGYDSRGG